MPHPYADKPDYCFWRRAIGPIEMDRVDPVVRGKFRIGPSDLVATAGSCFAQHMARHLAQAGFNHFVAETLNPFIPVDLAREYNYGVFSARYGNIYTARQLSQLLKRACGLFRPADEVWLGPDGHFYDPYRPRIQPGGFASKREFWMDRDQHLAAVRRVIEECDVFVFTLGLTEAWVNRKDGAVYPLCPGTAAGTFDPAQHEFVNFRMAELLADIREAFDFIRNRNPGVRFIVTVSPVALLATAEDRHVLVSTIHSKSVLRTVCGELEAGSDDVAYFPSYEIITGSFSRGAYFAHDMRDVTEAGVKHVMGLFMKHYTTQATENEPGQRSTPQTDAAHAMTSSIDKAVKVICDEEALDR